MREDLATVEELTDSELAVFQRLVMRFLQGRAYVRRPGRKGDAEWKFINHKQGLLAAYFAVMGWGYEFRHDLGVAVVRPRHRRHTKIFGMAETHMVYHLLLVHHELSQSSSLEEDRASITYGDLVEQVRSTVMGRQRINATDMKKTIRKLRLFGAVETPTGFDGEPEANIIVTPVIEMVLPPGRLKEQIEGLTASGEEDEAAEGSDPVSDSAEVEGVEA